MVMRIALAALALGLLAAPAMAGNYGDHPGSASGRDDSGGQSEGREADIAGRFMNSIGWGGGPYGGGSAHGPHANGGSCGCQGPGGLHAGPV